MCRIFLILLIVFSSGYTVAQISPLDSTEKQYAPYLRPEYRLNIEYNPGFTVWALGEEEAIIISTGISWFLRKKAAELVIPVFIEATTHKSNWFNSDYKGSAVTVDLRYREYLLGKIGGLFGSFGISWHYLNLNRLPDADTYISRRALVISEQTASVLDLAPDIVPFLMGISTGPSEYLWDHTFILSTKIIHS